MEESVTKSSSRRTAKVALICTSGFGGAGEVQSESCVRKGSPFGRRIEKTRSPFGRNSMTCRIPFPCNTTKGAARGESTPNTGTLNSDLHDTGSLEYVGAAKGEDAL